jgi:hypothetical protein
VNKSIFAKDAFASRFGGTNGGLSVENHVQGRHIRVNKHPAIKWVNPVLPNQ